MLVLLILGLVAALCLGIWLGLPGRYEQTPEEIEQIMASGTGRRKKLQKRPLSPVAWMRRNPSPRRGQTRRGGGFSLKAPDED